MGILGWIIFGLIIGSLAKLVMLGNDLGGIIVTMALGIVGSLLGGFLGQALGLYGPNDAAGFFMSLLGAVLLLAIYRMATGRRRVVLP
jgi:uncharacterized membrane protein YeaQ/YmgE (transglycosylase-associated protein family)